MQKVPVGSGGALVISFLDCDMAPSAMNTRSAYCAVVFTVYSKPCPLLRTSRTLVFQATVFSCRLASRRFLRSGLSISGRSYRLAAGRMFPSVRCHWYQQRIQEAAYLIRNRKKYVSEAGYELGFDNLNHFSRIFERYIGIKPQKYGMQ